MSSGHFHVHGTHEHVLEHKASSEHEDAFTSKVALITAVLSCVGAVFGFISGHHQSEATVLKSEATQIQTEAVDSWNQYQAKANRLSLAEIGLLIVTKEKQKPLIDSITRYTVEKAEVSAKAHRLEEDAKKLNAKSEHSLYLHERWAFALTILQIAIALSAISLFTRREWLLYLVYVLSSVSFVIPLFN